MNRLWVRLSMMIGGVLFLVFFMQFLSIMLSPDPDLPPQRTGQVVGDRDLEDLSPEDRQAEIARRLVHFMIFSVVIGIGSGIVIGRVVSAPITDLAQAAHRIGEGHLDTRVPMRGTREMVELAESFNKMATDLQHAETLRNNLMADVSHELRTPLTVLEGNLRAALDDVYGLDEADVANLYGQTRHLVRLVNDLRDLALADIHQLTLDKQPVDVKALVTEALQAIEPVAADKGLVLVDRVDSMPEMVADYVRIRQVLFNLLFNAMRHTPPGGEVVVQGTLVAGEVHLAVQDNGEGLEQDQLALVFDRFYRADRSRSRETGGSGLGLAIAKAIVEAHGGRVEARSQGKGHGSVFIIMLPASPA
jgi:signal transduction histidine kinase